MMRLLSMRGFTLIETMVAIAILGIALAGPFVAIHDSTNAANIARDQLIASSLAQEGVEYVISIRDNNFLYNTTHQLAPRNWLDGFSTLSCYGGSPANYCSVDPSQGDPHDLGNSTLAIQTCGTTAASCSPLYLSAGNIYNEQNSGTATRFTRAIQIRSISATEALVSVSVVYTSGHQSYTTTVTDDLENWL